MLDIAGQIQQHFFLGMCVVLVILSVFVIPFIWKTIDNIKFKKLEKDLKAKYGEDAFNCAS